MFGPLAALRLSIATEADSQVLGANQAHGMKLMSGDIEELMCYAVDPRNPHEDVGAWRGLYDLGADPTQTMPRQEGLDHFSNCGAHGAWSGLQSQSNLDLMHIGRPIPCLASLKSRRCRDKGPPEDSKAVFWPGRQQIA